MSQPVIFQSFSEYLARTVRAKEKYIPSYLKWVGACCTYFSRDPGQPLQARDQAREKGIAGVELPGALRRKHPNAGKEWLVLTLSLQKALH